MHGYATHFTSATPNSRGGNASIATGRYIGDGALQPIVTGLSGALKTVLIYSSPALGGGRGVYYSAPVLQPGGWRDSSGNTGVGLTFAGPDFTVGIGTGDGPNQVGFAYDWTAFAS